jgi:dUTP pyrophosphatase
MRPNNTQLESNGCRVGAKRLRDNARLPLRASAGAAAADLFAANPEDIVIPPGGRAGIPTGLAIELPDSGVVALIFSRSGHGAKSGVSLSNSVGVIDSDYRGEIIVGMINHGEQPFVVSEGDRIAQMMLTYTIPFEIEERGVLSDTGRGAGGFGSTGR